jgi:alkylresorcinol/alkylpyrone synthase
MRICEVGSAFPKNYSSQNVIRDALKSHWLDKLEGPQILDRLHSNVGVQGRHLALAIAGYEGLSTWGKANDASIPSRSGTRRAAVGGFGSEPVLLEW